MVDVMFGVNLLSFSFCGYSFHGSNKFLQIFCFVSDFDFVVFWCGGNFLLLLLRDVDFMLCSYRLQLSAWCVSYSDSW